MDCQQCIYGYYYDTCNATWADKQQYEKMLKSHNCPHYLEGHAIYLEHIANKDTE